MNWYVLETLTEPLYDAWDCLDPTPVVRRGSGPDATPAEQAAALAVSLAEPAAEAVDTGVKRRPLPRLRLSRLERSLAVHFGCEWTQGKGSERKVYREGYRHFTFGCHGAERVVHPVQFQKCLSRLGIHATEFLAALRR